jgi:F0F1-type ATP synthase membrane subunit b/b'
MESGMTGELAARAWHTKFEQQIRDLVDGVQTELDAAIAARAAESSAQAKRELSEDLNQRVRRLRQAAQRDALFTSLVDSSAPYCQRAAVFTFQEKEARAEAQRTVEELREKAEEESARIVARGEEQLANQRGAVVRELRAEIGTLAVELSEKIVDQRLADNAQVSATVDSFIAGLEAQDRAQAGSQS